MRIALVEAYLGGSHRAWADGYAAHSAHDVEIMGLPAVHWKWRMQGGHVTLAPMFADAVAAGGPFDAVLTTSMTDVAGFAGLARRSLGGAPIVLYVHENQLTFPLSEHDTPDLTYAMTNWTSMVAADAVVFNSEFHRADWFAALPGFLGRLPDQRHTSMIDGVARRSTVLPVGIDVATITAVPSRRRDRPLVLWNHRWEYDTAPDEFAAVLADLTSDGVEFDVALAGERFAEVPAAHGQISRLLGDRVIHDGFADPTTYRRLLRSSDVVVSTAIHEFFGVSVAEAVVAGAFPILPNRLAYPERVPPEHHTECLYDDRAGLVDRLRWALTHRDEARAIAARIPSHTLAWPIVARQYDTLLESLIT